MVSPRSTMPVRRRWLVLAAALASAFVSIRFLLLGAWPVLLFSVLDIGGLALALHVFARGIVPEERLRLIEGQIELVRIDRRGRRSSLSLPAYWTRLETGGCSELDHDLWLVFRRERHPVGLCVSADERRAMEPRIRAILDRARSRVA